MYSSVAATMTKFKDELLSVRCPYFYYLYIMTHIRKTCLGVCVHVSEKVMTEKSPLSSSMVWPMFDQSFAAK